MSNPHAFLPSADPCRVRPTTDTFETVVSAIQQALRLWGLSNGAEMLTFPPVMSLSDLYKCGYIGNFPNFVGSVHCLDAELSAQPIYSGSDFKLEDWTRGCRCTEFAMTPAACYPVYPIAAARGPVPEEGRTFGSFSYCFRREPSEQSSRLQSFRMQEIIYFGEAEQVLDFRENAIEHGRRFALRLGLRPDVKIAHDPFVGRAAKLLADVQLNRAEKYELLLDLGEGGSEVACMSFNYHSDRFGRIHDIRLRSGRLAHSMCFGTGLERFTMALLHAFGEDMRAWPEATLEGLGLDTSPPSSR
jgi:seryl-tRNA synthetase